MVNEDQLVKAGANAAAEQIAVALGHRLQIARGVEHPAAELQPSRGSDILRNGHGARPPESITR